MTVSYGRSRRRSIADWHSQYGQWHWSIHTDPFTQNGQNPVVSQDYLRSNPDWDSDGLGISRGREVTSDSNHGIRDSRDLRGVGIGDIGGAFFNQKRKVYAKGGMLPIHVDGAGVDNGNWYRCIYDGPCLAVNPGDSGYPTYSDTNLSAKGTTAIARCKPTNSVANLATTIAETVREGVPHLLGHATWKAKTGTAKDLAKAGSDEYLNVQFGWLPLVSDMHDSGYAIRNAHTILEQYERNSGQQVRRRYEFPVEQTETTEYIGQAEGGLYTGNHYAPMFDLSKPKPSLYVTRKFYRRTWFSGAFTYHLPVGYNSRDWLTRMSAKAGPLFGVELTPNVIWNVAPWTWAIDWFSNLGDVVDNLSDWATDGLVLRYGYIMEHTLQEDTYFLDGPVRYRTKVPAYASPITYSIETKRREAATPFGFGADWNTFSPRQLAIAAALGIKRVL